MPLSVLAGVDVNLSPEMMEAVRATTYSNSAKMGLAMKRRFWEEDDQIFGGHLYSNLPLGEFSYPSHDYFSKKGVLLGLYANGPVGDLLDQPVKDARRARADAREQGASADPSGVRERVRGVVAEGEVQPGRLRTGRAADAARAVREGRQPDPHRLRRRGAVLRARLAGRRGRRGVAGGEVAARARDAGVKESGIGTQDSGLP